MHLYNRVEPLETRRLLSSNLIADVGGIIPTDSATLNGTSYFAADDGTHGSELWKSDGTAAGTKMVTDIVPGATGSNVQSFDIVNNHVMFFADLAGGDIGLYRTDGTSDGTVLVADVGGKYAPPFTAVIGAPGHQKLVFYIKTKVSEGNYDGYVWSSDGTANNTFQINNYGDVEQLVDETGSNTHYYLPIADGRVVFDSNNHLYSTDGTIDGTIDLTQTSPAIQALPERFSYRLTPFGDRVAFMVGITTVSLFVTDGTAGGTRLLLNFNMSLNGLQAQFNGGISVAAGKLYIPEDFINAAHNTGAKAQELWVSDGTVAGSSKLLTLDHPALSLIGSVDGEALFNNYDPVQGTELWITDGTLAGTHLLKDINPGPGQSWANDFLPIDGVTYFDNVAGRDTDPNGVGHDQLWRTDGTPAGTVMVTDFSQYPEDQYVLRMVPVDSKIAFQIIRVGDPHETVINTLVYDPAHAIKPTGLIEAATTLRGGVLRVFGTRGDDTIRVFNVPNDPSEFFVDINGKRHSFNYADVQKLIIYGYSGNDNLGFKDMNGVVLLRSSIYGGLGNDTIYGGHSRDTISGDQGNDVIAGKGNADLLTGGDGDDCISGGVANDSISGDNGQDTLSGNDGRDVISGGNDQSKDYINGGEGGDVVFGQAVYDVFYSTSGDNDSTGDDVLMN